MSTASLQNHLVRLTIETNDQAILDQVIAFFEALRNKTAPNKDWWNDLTDAQIQMIEQSRAEADRGELISHNKVRKEIDRLIRPK